MPVKSQAFPRRKMIFLVGLFGLAAFALPAVQAQTMPATSPASTAPAYGGAATQGGPGSTNIATGERVEPRRPVAGAQAPAQQAGGLMPDQTKLSNADRNLMRTLAQIHLGEIDMGKMAQSRSQDVPVRSYAQRMIDEHSKALDELQKLANAKGVILPGGPDKKQVAAKEKLAVLTGDQFTEQYLTHAGDTAHREAHQFLQRAAQTAQDPELKAHANQSLAMVEQHLKMTNHLVAKNQTRFRRMQMEERADLPARIPSGGASQAAQQDSAAPASQPNGIQTAPGSAPR